MICAQWGDSADSGRVIANVILNLDFKLAIGVHRKSLADTYRTARICAGGKHLEKIDLLSIFLRRSARRRIITLA